MCNQFIGYGNHENLFCGTQKQHKNVQRYMYFAKDPVFFFNLTKLSINWELNNRGKNRLLIFRTPNVINRYQIYEIRAHNI